MTAPTLILAPFSAHQLARLRESLQVEHESWLDTRRVYDPEELGRRLDRDGIEILVVEADFIFEEVFQGAGSLRFVGVCRGSTGHVDLDAATEHGVVVANTPARNAQAVAEHTLALMLALARRIPESNSYLARGAWQDPTEPYRNMRGVELAGRTLGIVGLGAIGERVARMGRALGMEVLGHDPYRKSGADCCTPVSLDTLVAASDFVSIHVPGIRETDNLVDRRRLAMMKPSAYLVNTSDPSVVEREALVRALRGRRIAGAALDVFETHPIAPDNPLLGLDNVVLTPHLGGATAETIERHSRMMADDVLRFVAGIRPKNIVNPQVWRESV